jgi:hypothetical protein
MSVAPNSPDRIAVRVIQSWSTECGECGYGRGGWAGGPARDGKIPLTTSSPVCHGCGVVFTHERYGYCYPGIPEGMRSLV